MSKNKICRLFPTKKHRGADPVPEVPGVVKQLIGAPPWPCQEIVTQKFHYFYLPRKAAIPAAVFYPFLFTANRRNWLNLATNYR
jgi:hypothetical protein